MVETRSYRRVARGRKKRQVPLSKLRTWEVVRTLVDHPRRLEELLNLLDDTDRAIRGRAAVTLARLSESHPGRLVRVLERLRDALADDSAYVRWHIVYTLGRLGADLPVRAPRFFSDIITRLEDDNRIVRILACQALVRLAKCKPQMVKELLESAKHDAPPSVARVLRSSGLQPPAH